MESLINVLHPLLIGANPAVFVSLVNAPARSPLYPDATQFIVATDKTTLASHYFTLSGDVVLESEVSYRGGLVDLPESPAAMTNAVDYVQSNHYLAFTRGAVHLDSDLDYVRSSYTHLREKADAVVKVVVSAPNGDLTNATVVSATTLSVDEILADPWLT